MQRRRFIQSLSAVSLLSMSGCWRGDSVKNEPTLNEPTSDLPQEDNVKSIPASDSENAQINTIQEKTMNQTTAKTETKALVIYFSHSGNTRVIAQKIQAAVGADLFEVKPVDAYPVDYDTVVKQAKKEIDAGYQPAIQASVENLSQYDTIYFGSPCWWGTIAPPLATLLTNSDFSGKTIRPFMTHEGSGMGRSIADIRKMAPKADVQNGLAIWGHSVKQAQAEVERWV